MDADGLAASETPASKRECPSPAASASPGSESKYKVVVKPPFDACLKTTAFRGFSIHHPTNSISVWVRSLADVDRLTELRTLPATADSTVQVQAYLSSGSDLRRYVVSGVDPGESRESLVDALTCSTHEVVTARYMGRGRTCLVTLQGPRMPPSRITYYGCILQFHVYKPGVVHCYRCFRTGHMRASCPQSTDASMESAETPTCKCGLCQTDDHDITSKDCPVKQKAIKARRQRRRRERSATQEERDADIPTSNRFELLSPSEEDTLALEQPDNTYFGGPAYSTVLKRGKKRAQQATSTPELTDTTADDLVKLDQQIAQLQMEVKRITQRRVIFARPAGPTTTREKGAPCAASVPESPCTSASPQAKLTPAELVHFVARQLQELSNGNCRGLVNKVGEIRHRHALGKLPAWCLLLQETNSLPRVPGFTGYASPTIPDRRCTNELGPPGKAAVYVATSYPQTQVPLMSWCNEWQEVVAVLVRLPRTDVIVVSVYVRPYSGSAPRLRIGSLAHLRRTHPGYPVLVGGDFNAPHHSWGYPTSSARGSIVLDTFTDAHFVLLNAPATSTRRWDHSSAPPYAPDLSWWLGMCAVSWDREPDCWGSDHHPLIIRLAANSQRRLRRRCYITDWDLFRKELDALIAAPSSDPLQVEENRPPPNLHLLRLWAARRRAQLALNQDPAAVELRDNLNKLTAAARRCEKRLSRERWTGVRPSAHRLHPHRSGERSGAWKEALACRTQRPTPICLTLNGQALSTVSTIRVPGVELDASGSASAWVRSARRKTHYYNSTLPQPAAPLPEIPPWLKAQASDNRPLTRLRQSNRQVGHEAVVTTIDDSLAAVLELRKVISSLDIASDVHRLIYSCACPVRVLWSRRSTLAQMAADAACHPAEVQHPLPLLRFWAECAVMKSTKLGRARSCEKEVGEEAKLGRAQIKMSAAQGRAYSEDGSE
ncbi:hypothetical protein HPB52_008223 [Rhipicephalus sanguineus]|uniref:CCHC-type domain-containing protein n=1 Tax=Rhipicephalus sanguineus TaxID=34632 RepID=A0A9D4QDZ8_RHISA|nr:hypothetical protein HPB52_008223 [Rhipicephalus sanguineus]